MKHRTTNQRRRSDEACLLATLSLGIFFVAGLLLFGVSADSSRAETPVPRVAPVAFETQPVKLYRAKPVRRSKSAQAVALAALTPECSVHDFGCVLQASGVRFDQPGKGKR